MPVILLDVNAIKKYLIEDNQNLKIEIFQNISSTSDYLKQAKFTPNILPICLAEQQTAGHGRFGRNWFSPFGSNIYFSGLWHFHKDISELSGLGLVVALAIVKALNILGISEDIKVKWPNDIVWQQQKLAGILIDISAETHGYTQAIIGIGMNVNMPEAAKDEIKQPWTSLQNITDYAHDRNKIVAEMIQQLQNYIKQFTVNGLNYFLEEWRQYDALLQKRIHLEHSHQTIAGVVCGINSQGNLVLHQDDGTIAAYSSGDTSIRK